MGLTIHCINLARRTDRWARCQEIGAQYGIEFVRTSTPDMPGRAWIGCAISHQIAVYDAKLREDPYVLVAEDDLEFTTAFSVERFEDLIVEADKIGIEILTTGTVSYAQDVVDVHGAIVETHAPLSTQLTCYFARGYDKVLRLPIGFGADWGQDPGVPGEHVDRMRMLPSEPMRRAVTLPFLTIQRDDWSDNCGQVLRLADNWKRAEESWRNVTRSTPRHTPVGS